MVFNATFNNISVISWRSILLVEKTMDLSQVTDKLNVYTNTTKTQAEHDIHIFKRISFFSLRDKCLSRLFCSLILPTDITKM